MVALCHRAKQAVETSLRVRAQNRGRESGACFCSKSNRTTTLGRVAHDELFRSDACSRDPIGYVDGMSLYTAYSAEQLSLDPHGLSLFCNRLKERINNLAMKIRKRQADLRENRHSLPEAHPLDNQFPRLSRRGHRRLINIDKKDLDRRINEFINKCGPIPDDIRPLPVPITEPVPEPDPVECPPMLGFPIIDPDNPWWPLPIPTSKPWYWPLPAPPEVGWPISPSPRPGVGPRIPGVRSPGVRIPIRIPILL